MKRVAVQLGPVQETLLIPLLGRSEETRKTRGLLHDPKSVEIVESLEYDFTKWKGIPSLAGACVRACLFDQHVRDFLDAHPQGTIVEIGAGLNTRYERLDNGQAHWIEIDLPDSMTLRRQFFDDEARRTMMAASVLDEGWLDEVAERPGPVCFVSEAVIVYLDEPDVERALRQIGRRFPGAWLITDTVSRKMVDEQHKHDAMRTMPKASWFRWKCDDPRTLEAWGLRLVRSETFLDAPSDVVDRMPWSFRMLTRWAPWLIRRRVEGYRINRFLMG
ncbi:MAG: class I SAM-dependent methyltransferase [Myxococcota bacterium]